MLYPNWSDLRLAAVKVPQDWPDWDSIRKLGKIDARRHVQAILLSNLSSWPYIGPGLTMIASGKTALTASSPLAFD